MGCLHPLLREGPLRGPSGEDAGQAEPGSLQTSPQPPLPSPGGTHSAVHPFTVSSLRWEGTRLFVRYDHCLCCYDSVVRTREVRPLSKVGRGHQVSGTHSLLSGMRGAWSSRQRRALLFSLRAASARRGARS
ncbi:hypothetical protein HJG60_009407 [Phyllostomus discolor]|uniref:Uncharacterized protein n=1 Tax=Phyllostomus discolor TaxID=89673 RepID=A0A833YJ24_9CHIR|nr:hypothetical protein HJG60_009407 [Phyllostomus discolor]